jgi:hypothetical protein
MTRDKHSDSDRFLRLLGAKRRKAAVNGVGGLGGVYPMRPGKPGDRQRRSDSAGPVRRGLDRHSSGFKKRCENEPVS